MSVRKPETPRLLPLWILVTMLGLAAVGYLAGRADMDTEEAEEAAAIEVDPLDLGIAAHGGLSKWQSYASLEYDVESYGSVQHHMIDLTSRRTLLETEAFRIGFDGTNVWVTPGLDAVRVRPSFLNGLDFYFFGMPFVLADPGVIRESLGRVTVGHEEFEAVRISFQEGIGGSPDDSYIAHFDPTTHRLRFLLYTVTFFSGEPSENLNARVYDEWQQLGGLTVPAKATSYAWDAEKETFGTARGEAVYSNVQFSADAPADSMFAMPEGAELDVQTVGAEE